MAIKGQIATMSMTSTGSMAIQPRLHTQCLPTPSTRTSASHGASMVCWRTERRKRKDKEKRGRRRKRRGEKSWHCSRRYTQTHTHTCPCWWQLLDRSWLKSSLMMAKSELACLLVAIPLASLLKITSAASSKARTLVMWS